MKKNNKGFTLIELLAVITIMGILMMVAIPAVTRTIENSRRDTFVNVAKSYINAVREEVLADGIKCAGNYVSTLTPTATKYYYPIDTESTGTQDLMEKGGKSPWGNAELKGYVLITPTPLPASTNSSASIQIVYSIILADKNGHGINTETKEDALSRSTVQTKGATQLSAPSGTVIACSLSD